MTAESAEPHEDPALAYAARIRALQGGGPARARRPMLIPLAILATLGAGGLMWLRETGRLADLPPLVASTAEAFQQGLSSAPLAFPAAPAPAPLRIMVPSPVPIPVSVTPPAPSPPPGPDPATRRLEAEIAALKASLAALAAAKPAPADTRSAELQRQLDAEKARAAEALAAREAALRAGFEAERAAALGDQAIAAERAARLAETEARIAAEARAAAEAQAQRQIIAPALVYDAGRGDAPAGPAPSRPANADEDFLAAAGEAVTKTSVAAQIAYPDRTVIEGSLIEAVLETAIDTSLPGGIRASIAADVWSWDGSTVLLPKGTRLVGSYRADLALGQERALVIWTRAITPEGASVALGSTGTDPLGRSGVAGDLDTRFAERFGSAALVSLISALPALALGRSTDTRAGTETVRGLGDTLGDSTGSALERYLTLAPTLRVDQGAAVTVFVGRDLVILPR